MCNTTFTRGSDPLYTKFYAKDYESRFSPRESSNALGIVR